MVLNRSHEFENLNIKYSAQLFCTLRPILKELYYAMLNTKFQVSETSGSAADFFHILLCISMV